MKKEKNIYIYVVCECTMHALSLSNWIVFVKILLFLYLATLHVAYTTEYISTGIEIHWVFKNECAVIQISLCIKYRYMDGGWMNGALCVCVCVCACVWIWIWNVVVCVVDTHFSSFIRYCRCCCWCGYWCCMQLLERKRTRKICISQRKRNIGMLCSV